MGQRTGIQAYAPAEAREAMVTFQWEQRKWPLDTIEEYYRVWDWRYSSLSDGEPRIWLAYDGGEVVGHHAAYFRRYRVGERELRVAVPGNFFVRVDRRDTLAGARLAAAPRSLVRDGEADLVTAYGNMAAHQLFLRLGFHELGGFETLADVRRWGPVLARRIGVAAAAGPLLDAAFRIRRARRQVPQTRGLSVRRLAREEVLQLDCSHWARLDRGLVADNHPEYLARRYLDHPLTPIHLFGLIDGTGRVQGYVAFAGNRGEVVWDCQANPAVITEANAVMRAADELPEAETVLVPTLPQSDLANALVRAGFLHRPPANAVLAHSFWSAYWAPSHPLAERLADRRTWRLWFGACHY